MGKYEIEFKSKYWGKSPIHLNEEENELWKDVSLKFTEEEIQENKNLKYMIESNTEKIVLPDKFLNSMVGDYFTVENEEIVQVKPNLEVFKKIMELILPLLRRDYKGTCCNPYNYKNPYETSRLAFIKHNNSIFCLECTLDAFSVKESELPIYKEVDLLYSYVDKYDNTFYIERYGDKCWINPNSSLHYESDLPHRISLIEDKATRDKVTTEVLDILSKFPIAYRNTQKTKENISKLTYFK